MANNAPAHKPSHVISGRMSYKPTGVDMPQIARALQQPTVFSVNAKDANKDKSRKPKAATPSVTINPKQISKRPELAEQSRAPAAAAPSRVRSPVPSPLAKAATSERTVVLTRHAQQLQQLKQTRKAKLDESVAKSKALRTTAPETALTTSKHPKERKSPDKAEAAVQRPIRNKNQSHNTKVFFDKYLKFAYDLSKPEGVRQLEAHFFPAEAQRSKQTKNKPDSGDSPEKQPSADEKCSGMGKYLDTAEQIIQQSKCFQNV